MMHGSDVRSPTHFTTQNLINPECSAYNELDEAVHI